MKYIDNKLFIEKVSVEKINKLFNTPTYCYSYNQLKENIINFRRNFRSISPLVCFAVKSNTNINLIKEIKKEYLVSIEEVTVAEEKVVFKLPKELN